MYYRLAKVWLCLVCTIIECSLVTSHVVLTYPFPRDLQLDSLDNATSTQPCGTNKGSVKTTIQSGRPFNVTWRLPYPARVGGYRLQLLDSLSRPLLDLTPVTSESLFVVLDSRTENLTVTVPSDYECDNCTIRLVRESQEWPEKKWFWSCADVDIKSKKAYRETCSGHGRYILSKCRCDKLYYGEYCQLRDECIENSDCGGETGRCIQLDTTASPSKQCFCQTGWFGPNCASRSPIRSNNYDLSGHMHKELIEGFNLYWRLMVEADEIEIAIIANTTNYVALGWRPNNITLDCRYVLKNKNITVINAEDDANEELALHPMECTDIVVGVARGSAFKVADYFSADQSSPKLDTFWKGRSDITGAYGFETDGVTTVIFRKKIKAVHPTDHSIIDEDMHVIWARGQDTKNTSYWFQNDSDTKIIDNDFYKDDDLKYHGFIGNRGVTKINFFDEQLNNQEDNSNKNSSDPKKPVVAQTCFGEWKHPKSCSISEEDCEYSAQWWYLPEKDSIRFTISTNNTGLWTGIGFSNDHKMAQTDAIIGLVDKTGRAFVMDTWIVGRTSPFLDSSQDVSNVSAKITNGRTTMTFERKRSTGDTRDLAFTDDECLYMMFPTKGGEFNAVNKKIRQHLVTPSISSTRICIRACYSDGTSQGKSLSGKYHLKVQLASLGKDFKLPKEGSSEYETFSGSITSAIKQLLVRYQKSLVINFKGFSKEQDHVMTSLELNLENKYLHAPVRKTLENAIVKGQIGNILLQPGYWHFTEVEDPSNGSDTFEEFHKRILTTILESWVVVGCLIALLALILLQACCTLCCKSSSQQNQKDTMYPNMAWKDYSGSGLNYGVEKVERNEKDSGAWSKGPALGPEDTKGLTLEHGGKLAKKGRGKQALEPGMQGGAGCRTTQTLPRVPAHPQVDSPYYTHRPARPVTSHSGPVQPDFYFMPSQRKYSGEVVRVYVDYDNQTNK